MKFINQAKKYSIRLFRKGKAILISKSGNDQFIGWIVLIIIVLIVGGLLVAWVNGAFPGFLDGLSDKIQGMFNFIKF